MKKVMSIFIIMFLCLSTISQVNAKKNDDKDEAVKVTGVVSFTNESEDKKPPVIVTGDRTKVSFIYIMLITTGCFIAIYLVNEIKKEGK